MLELTMLSERQACRLAGLSRDAFRHPPEPSIATQALSARIIELARVRRRFGYRRLHDLLRPEFPNVNHKNVYRLYCDANLAVRRRKKARRPASERQALSPASAPNRVWSMDFVSDALANGRRLKCLCDCGPFSIRITGAVMPRDPAAQCWHRDPAQWKPSPKGSPTALPARAGRRGRRAAACPTR